MVDIPIDPPVVPPITPPMPGQPGMLPTASIQVYRVLDPEVVIRAADTIRRALFPNVGGGRELQVHPASCALWFDTGQRGGGSTAPSEVRAREVALAFLDGARLRLGRTSLPSDLVPDGLKLVDVKRIGSPWPGTGASAVCRFVRTLRPSATEQPVPVLGETVDVWVDDAGAVQAFGSTCRPVASATPAARLPTPKDDPQAEDEDPMLLMYLSGDENDVRDTTCPFWIRWDDDEALVLPASAQSMVIGMTPTPTSGAMALTASVLGGSGRYDYDWLAWSPTAPDEFVSLGGGSSTRIGPGVWDVALRVRDNETGVSEQIASQVVCAHG
jgi:hypothetical protein